MFMLIETISRPSFWLQPVGLARNLGYSPKELRRIQKLVTAHQVELLETWHGHFGAEG